MKNFIVLISTILIGNATFAQAYIKARAVNFDPNTCNNTVVCEVYGMDYPHFVHYNAMPVFDGDTIENFCFYDYATIGSNGIEYYGSNGYINHFLGASGLIAPNFNYTTSAFVGPTDATSEDGSFEITFDSSVTSFNLSVMQDNGYIPTITIVDAYTINLSNLNEGYTSILIQDPSDIYNYADFRIYAGNPSDIYVNTGMDLNINFQHAGTSCSGWINLQANPPGTYYNVWSDGISNTTTRTDLCPGIYSVFSYNLVSGLYDVGSIDTLVITNDSLTYIDTNLFNMIPQDTSYYFTTDCFFDYYQPIDSITYSEDTIFYSDPLLIATFEMNIYQGNNMITITDSLVTVTDSTVLLDVVVYCTLFKAPFMAQRIMFLRGVENHFFVSPHLDVPYEEVEKSPIMNVYPNPSNGKFVLDVNTELVTNYKLNVLDASGRIIYEDASNESSTTIDLNNFSDGIYFLQLFANDQIFQKKLIKQ